MANAATVQQEWLLVDAENEVLGRLASKVAMIVRGKHKSTFTPHVNCGDHVVVINADKVRVTGRKEVQKNYYSHSMYNGGLSTTSLKEMRARHPERIIEHAVRGMLPGSNLGRQQLKKLKVYAGPHHPHAANSPAELALDDTATR